MTKKNDAVVVRTEESLPGRMEPETDYVRPSTDIYESPEAFVLLMEMPGSAKDLINMTVDQNMLVVKGQLRQLHGKETRLLSGELRKKGYFRMFQLGEGVDRNSIDARYDQGVLTVKLFKKEEVRPREISIT
jgi:HSP20 family protein